MPPESISLLKKIELLFAYDKDDELQMTLVCQYEESLWSVNLSAKEEPKKLLPSQDHEM